MKDNTKLEQYLVKLAAEFFNEESNRQSLVTVTRATLSGDRSQATIYFSVLEREQEESVLNFAKRKRPDFREYLKKNARLRRLPFLDFEIDEGEKHRQRIEELSRE